ncbi:MAG: Twin-arginine translocation pathway signal, partial [Polaromonas sp.]|nr:Twin-arginine translocation pathway signal [Polaromonas sp.]
MASSTSRRVLNTLRNTVAVGALLLAGIAQAQTGTIRLLVGFPAGGGTDVIART